VVSFQVYDALGILFELEKPPVEHLKGFILLPKKQTLLVSLQSQVLLILIIILV
jgi:hypothetical protein